jgi:quercetin dioxygenase-like cupin family protein
MSEVHFTNSEDLPWSEDPRFPGIGVKILESRLTHPTTSVVLVRLNPGIVIQTHTHPAETETAYVLAGRGRLTYSDVETVFESGMSVTIPPGIPHSLANVGDEVLELIALHSPPTR